MIVKVIRGQGISNVSEVKKVSKRVQDKTKITSVGVYGLAST